VFEFGADDFLSKPFRARALSARLDAVLRRTRKG
jgi:DNA-binding response OmpR family regulator